MFHRSSCLMGAIMMMTVGFVLTQTGKDANAFEVPSVFETYFVQELPVLSRTGEARLASQEATSTPPAIKIISIKGGKVAIGGSRGTLPVVHNRKVVVGVAEDRRGRRVHFKVVRGDRVPSAERATATFPFEMSACFTDADGNSMFQLAVGEPVGDTIPECGPPHEEGAVEGLSAESDTLPTAREQAHRMKATINTMGALARLEFTHDFAEEFRALTEARQALRKMHRSGEERITASDSVIILGEDGQPVINGTTIAEANLAFAMSSAGSSDLAKPMVTWMRGRRHIVEMHASYIHNTALLAEHSATYTARYEESPAPFGKFYDIRSNCNHGRCPWEMTFRYLLFSAPRSWTHVHNWFCTTGYNAVSWTGTHNCHDDTVCTTRSVRLDTHWPANWGTPCSDPWVRRYAPPWYE